MSPLTKRQAEALWAARETGAVYNLVGRRVGGAQERMCQQLADRGLLIWRDSRDVVVKGEWGTITAAGLAELASWQLAHPRIALAPRITRGSKS